MCGIIRGRRNFEVLEVCIEFGELQKIAQDTLNQRRLSRLAAAMVTAGESKIVKMVATGVDDNGCGCAPCGRCREFINCLHEDNHLCEVLMEDGSITTIGALLPYRL